LRKFQAKKTHGNDILQTVNSAGAKINIEYALLEQSDRDIVGVQNLEPLRIDFSSLPPGLYTINCGGQFAKFVKM
jgi:hypothetical protein